MPMQNRTNGTCIQCRRTDIAIVSRGRCDRCRKPPYGPRADGDDGSAHDIKSAKSRLHEAKVITGGSDAYEIYQNIGWSEEDLAIFEELSFDAYSPEGFEKLRLDYEVMTATRDPGHGRLDGEDIDDDVDSSESTKEATKKKEEAKRRRTHDALVARHDKKARHLLIKTAGWKAEPLAVVAEINSHYYYSAEKRERLRLTYEAKKMAKVSLEDDEEQAYGVAS